MKLLFLDIDGVLNCAVTKERWNGLIGIDRRLVSTFLQWLSGKDVGIVLSSTWRLYDDTKEHLAAAGLSWMGHVWTAPAVQEESDYQRSVRVQSCIRPLKAAVLTAGPDVVR